MNRKERTSGIEILKIAAVFIIVISHVTHTLGTRDNGFISYADIYALDLSLATTDIQRIILIIFKHFGALGNLIFFICSAWFLVGDKNVSKRKIALLETDIWSVSVLFLVAFFAFRGHVGLKLVIQSLFPTSFKNNWYMTCYMIIYAVHTHLNKVIDSMDRNRLLTAALVLSFLYLFTGLISYSFFYESDLMVFITVYFIVAYVKKYMNRSAESIKFNACLFLCGTAGFLVSILLLDLAGLKVGALNDKVLHWDRNCNPFLIMMALSLFNLARKEISVKPMINRFAGMSFLIYIMHENLLVRTYLRPRIWLIIHERFGYAHVVFWCIAYSLILFIVSSILSAVYTALLQKPLHQAGLFVYELCRIVFHRIKDRILKYD